MWYSCTLRTSHTAGASSGYTWREFFVTEELEESTRLGASQRPLSTEVNFRGVWRLQAGSSGHAHLFGGPECLIMRHDDPEISVRWSRWPSCRADALGPGGADALTKKCPSESGWLGCWVKDLTLKVARRRCVSRLPDRTDRARRHCLKGRRLLHRIQRRPGRWRNRRQCADLAAIGP